LEDSGLPSGKVARRYIVRLKEDVQDLEAAISMWGSSFQAEYLFNLNTRIMLCK
jgi:hypothetical protein